MKDVVLFLGFKSRRAAEFDVIYAGTSTVDGQAKVDALTPADGYEWFGRCKNPMLIPVRAAGIIAAEARAREASKAVPPASPAVETPPEESGGRKPKRSKPAAE